MRRFLLLGLLGAAGALALALAGLATAQIMPVDGGSAPTTHEPSTGRSTDETTTDETTTDETTTDCSGGDSSAGRDDGCDTTTDERGAGGSGG